MIESIAQELAKYRKRLLRVRRTREQKDRKPCGKFSTRFSPKQGDNRFVCRVSKGCRNKKRSRTIREQVTATSGKGDLVSRISAEAWKKVTENTTAVTCNTDAAVTEKVTGVTLFTENLLRDIIQLTPAQQFELVSGLVDGTLTKLN